jgi:hypothetical protein
MKVKSYMFPSIFMRDKNLTLTQWSVWNSILTHQRMIKPCDTARPTANTNPTCPSPPSGPMTWARAKVLQDEGLHSSICVNSIHLWMACYFTWVLCAFSGTIPKKTRPRTLAPVPEKDIKTEKPSRTGTTAWAAGTTDLEAFVHHYRPTSSLHQGRHFWATTGHPPTALRYHPGTTPVVNRKYHSRTGTTAWPTSTTAWPG